MTVDLDFDWTKPDEENQADRLNRGKYAEFLTNYLSGYTDDSYVMNLNAEWGAGKTWFLKRWQQTIQYQHPTAYIDAWQNDFSDDPLLTVIAGISDALKAYPNVSSYQYTKKVAKTGGRFLKQAAPAFLNALMKHYTGLDSKNFKLEDFGDFAEKALEASLDDHNAKVRDIEGFKRAISDWINKAVGSRVDGSPGKPMFVFIDELDRCRPTYAIELLETVKHLFDIKGLVFVIATNTDQLQHSIKAVYGQGFDAQRYLCRFFNRSFTLKEPDLLQFIWAQPVFKDHLVSELSGTCYGKVITDEQGLANSLSAIAEGFDFDLRTTLQWLDQLSAIFSNEEYQNRYFWLWCGILMAVKLKSNSVFEYLFVNRTLSRDYGITEQQAVTEMLSGIMNKPQRLGGKSLCLYVTADVADRYLSMSQSGRKEQYEGQGVVTESLIVSISKFLTTGNFIAHIDNWQRKDENSSPDQSSVLNMAAYEFQENGATRGGYIDLVELASDLT